MTLEQLINTLPKDSEAVREYNLLRSDAWFLDCLRGAGVDNWEGYEDAQAMYEELGEK